MQADFAVELGPADETLEIPWSDEASGLRYHDLKRNPHLLPQVEEAQRFEELGDFLAALNAPTSMFETAKCDVWTSTEMNVEDEIFGAKCKFGSYVDFLFTEEPRCHSFPEHEQLGKRLTGLLKKVPDIPASAEFLIRRCYFHAEGEMQDGFYTTLYVIGYGEDESQARQRWAIALKLVENAMRQSST